MSGNLLQKTALALLTSVSLGSACADASTSAPASKTAEASAAIFEIIAADIAVHRSQPGLAYELLAGTVKRTHDPKIAGLAWQAAMRTGNIGNVQAASREWVKLDPNNPVPHRTILAYAIENGQIDDINRELETLHAIEKNKPAWTAVMTQSMLRSGVNLSLVRRAMEPYWNMYSDNPDVLIAMGAYQQAMHNPKEACTYVERAYAKQPNDEKIVSTAADLCWESDRDSAFGMLENYLRAHPKNAAVRLMYGRALARAGRTEEALAQLKKSVASSPDEPLILINGGQLAYECRDFPLAEQYLQKYIEVVQEKMPGLDLSRSEVWLRLAAALHEDGRHGEEAERLAELTDGPLAVQARMREAEALAEIGHIERARSVLEEAAKKHPESRDELLIAEAKLLVSQKRSDEAMAMLEEHLRANPDDVRLHYDTAILAEQVGHTERAEALLRGILREHPDHVQANNALGYIMVTHGDSLPEARRLLEHAYRLAPLDPFVLDSMGWLCFKEGRYDQAAEFTLTSLKKLFDVEVAGHLIEILQASGRGSEAASLYRELCKRAGKDPRVQELGKRLKLSAP
jgi:tetratricopeptide (TPR) repeat protein